VSHRPTRIKLSVLLLRMGSKDMRRYPLLPRHVLKYNYVSEASRTMYVHIHTSTEDGYCLEFTPCSYVHVLRVWCSQASRKSHRPSRQTWQDNTHRGTKGRAVGLSGCRAVGLLDLLAKWQSQTQRSLTSKLPEVTGLHGTTSVSAPNSAPSTPSSAPGL